MNSFERQMFNENVAIEVFGWQWVRRIGVPVEGTPGYPRECPVRVLLPPELFLSLEHLGPATGDEPLSFHYSQPPIPELLRIKDYAGADDVHVLGYMRSLPRNCSVFRKFESRLGKAVSRYRLGDFSRAALAAIREENGTPPQ